MKKGLILLFLIFLTLNINATKTELNLYQSEEYLAFAEEMPTPLGGMEGIYSMIKYPELAIKGGVQGKVYVLAFVNENGEVDDVKVVKGIGAGCDEETIAAVKKTKFSPAKSGGKNVKVKMSLQIQFKLT